jgi:hypothetical protein
LNNWPAKHCFPNLAGSHLLQPHKPAVKVTETGNTRLSRVLSGERASPKWIPLPSNQAASPNPAKTMHPGIGGDQIYRERASPSLIPSTGRQHQATWSPKNRQQSQASTTAGKGWQLLNNWPANHCFQPTNAHTVQLRGQY